MSGFWQQIEDHVRRVAWGRTSAESEALARKELEERAARWLERERRAVVPRFGGFPSRSEPPKNLPAVDGGPAPGAKG